MISDPDRVLEVGQYNKIFDMSLKFKLRCSE